MNPIPDNYPRVNPFLMVTDIQKESEFLKQVFDAVESERITLPDGEIMHMEMRIEDSVIMIGQEAEGMTGMHSMTYLYVKDTAATYAKALKAGATSIMPPGKQFYGDINAGVQDEFGHYWWIASKFEEVSEEELNKRAAKFRQN